jgi:hypothetical protein
MDGAMMTDKRTLDSTMTDKRTLEQHGRAMMRIFGFELQTVGVTG